MSWLLRSELCQQYGTPLYGDGSDFFTLKILHGGHFLQLPKKLYMGDNICCDYIDFCEFDKISLVEIESMAKQLGYFGIVKLYRADSCETVKEICNDVDVLELNFFLSKDGEVEIFLDCKTLFEILQEEVGLGTTEMNDVPIENASGVVEGDGDESDDSDSSRSCESMCDSAYDNDNDDDLFDKYVDKDLEFCGNDLKGKRKIDEGPHVVDEGDNEGIDSDDLVSLVGSDEDEDGPKFPVFNEKTEMANPIFKLGMLFANHKVLKEAIRNYSIKSGREIRFPQNEARRVRAICHKGCPWTIYASKMQHSTTIQIKTFNNEHKCNRQFSNCNVNSGWLSKNYLDTFKTNPKIPVKSFKETVMKDLVVGVSRSQFYRTRKKATEFIEGTYSDQYANLWNYMEEIRRTNPGTTIHMHVEEGKIGQPRFQRLYVCLEACKKGFKAGCRKVIGVDGCHLKGPHGGVLLTAVSVDANNCMYPIAYAVVEGETKRSWTWFLESLQQDLGIYNQYQWTFISDKQKGLLPAFELVLPMVEHRFCVMHLHSNFKTAGYGGKALKDCLWNAARATNLTHFRAAMKKLEETDSKAYGWLQDKPPLYWARSHFNKIPKCDMLLNNICENFNKCILDPREKPIIGLLEGLRNYLMVRLQQCREKSDRWYGRICPKIQERLEKYKYDSGKCIPTWAGEDQFQISCMNGDQYIVELNNKSCSCGGWDLTGIPCPHAISALFFMGEDVEEHVHKCYWVETYRMIYEPHISPINGSNMWPVTRKKGVLPPIYESQPGRKRKNRKKQAHELQKKVKENESSKTKLGKNHQNSVKCSYCLTVGHNKRSCNKRKAAGVPSGGDHSSHAIPLTPRRLPTDVEEPRNEASHFTPRRSPRKLTKTSTSGRVQGGNKASHHIEKQHFQSKTKKAAGDGVHLKAPPNQVNKRVPLGRGVNIRSPIGGGVNITGTIGGVNIRGPVGGGVNIKAPPRFISQPTLEAAAKGFKEA